MNPKYIDKNHAGTLIIWDRFFGTFQKEEEEVYYGITKPLASWNPVWANLHYWDDLVKTARQSPKISDKVKVFLKPPGWFPKHLGGIQIPPEINALTYKKYNPEYQSKLTGYVFVQFLIALISGSVILFSYTKIEPFTLVAGTIFTLCTLVTCGALLERKQWLIKFEYFRLAFGLILVLILKFPIGYQVIFAGIQLISVIWFFNLQKANLNPNEN